MMCFKILLYESIMLQFVFYLNIQFIQHRTIILNDPCKRRVSSSSHYTNNLDIMF